MENKRLVYIDWLRSFGMILIIMGHIHFGENFEHYIFAFHVPLFFFVSGLFYKRDKYNFIEFLKKKIKSLVFPYFLWAVIYEIIALFFGKQNWLGIVWNNTILVPIGGAFWFLTALFIVEILGFVILKIQNLFICILLTVLIVGVGMFHFVNLPFSGDTALAALGFWILGYFYNTYVHIKLLNKSMNIFLIICLMVLNAVSIYFSPTINMKNCAFGNYLLFWVNSVFAILIFLQFFQWIYQKTEFKNTKFSIFFMQIGMNSIVYLLTHQLIIQIIKLPLEKFGIDLFTANVFIQTGSLLIILAVCHCISIFLKKEPYNILLGKF
ncbi:MAG: acyltransferase family protein [Bacteroidales bacterium]|nr:acyltransferase family protein [Bacteroidales bacterium]